jgi:hypothetical protein
MGQVRLFGKFGFVVTLQQLKAEIQTIENFRFLPLFGNLALIGHQRFETST